MSSLSSLISLVIPVIILSPGFLLLHHFLHITLIRLCCWVIVDVLMRMLLAFQYFLHFCVEICSMVSWFVYIFSPGNHGHTSTDKYFLNMLKSQGPVPTTIQRGENFLQNRPELINTALCKCSNDYSNTLHHNYTNLREIKEQRGCELRLCDVSW
jgi:hypothetical protein